MASGAPASDGLARQELPADFAALAADLASALARHRATLLLVAGLAWIVLAWERVVAMSVGGLGPVAAFAAAMLGFGALWQATAGRLAAERGGRFYPAMARAGETLAAFGIWCGFLSLLEILSYLCARTQLPLQDGAFDAFGQALGFDWLAWYREVEAAPAVKRLLFAAYESMFPQVALVFLIAAFHRDPRRLDEYRWTAIVAGLATCLISAMLPAVGATALHGVGGAPWLPDILTLRGAPPATFVLNDMTGIISFPSFHTVLGLLFVWTARGTGPLFWGLAVLNALLVTATLTEGGHHLADVFGGAAVLAGSIFAVRVVIRRQSRAARH